MKIAFDIDGTLLDGFGNPRHEIIDILRSLYVLTLSSQQPSTIYIWSGGGVNYAANRLKQLGLSHLIDYVIVKEKREDIDICFDDQEVNLAKVNIKV